VKATQSSFDCELVRVATIKKRSKQTLAPGTDWHVKIDRGQKSLIT
jgi:hypothetical protein